MVDFWIKIAIQCITGTVNFSYVCAWLCSVLLYYATMLRVEIARIYLLKSCSLSVSV